MFQPHHVDDVGTADPTCSICDRPRPEDRMTGSGICTDCLPQQRNPIPGIGPGRQAVRTRLNTYRSTKREPRP